MISLRMFQVVGSAQHFDDWYTAALGKKYCFTWKNNTVSLGKTILFNWKKNNTVSLGKTIPFQYCFIGKNNAFPLGKTILFHWGKTVYS